MQTNVLFKTALCSVPGRPLDLKGNADHMARALAQANAAGAKLTVFALESISAHTAGDLLLPGLKAALYRAVLQVAAASGEGLCLYSFRMAAGGRQTLAVAAARQGALWAVGFPQLDIHTIRPFLHEVKAHLGPQVAVAGAPNFPIPGTEQVVGVMLKPDAQAARHLMAIGATVMACMEAVPAQAGHRRADALAALSHTLGCPCLGVNAGAVESTTDAVYGGERSACHSGQVLAQTHPFDAREVLVVDMPSAVSPAPPPSPPAPHPRMPYAPKDSRLLSAWCREAGEIAARGLAARLTRVGSRSVLLGLSGGLDSAMALLTARRALELAGLPPNNLLAYSLPALGTSGRTRQNALKLMRALGLEEREIDLKDQVLRHLKAIGHDLSPDAAYENAQARMRTQVLMDLCNMHAGLMVGPGDMSELALGFTTYGGDHMSMYGVNAGLPKTAIRLMIRQAALDTDNPALRDVLEDVLKTPISPELLPGGSTQQQTEHILGDYDVNDCILWHLLKGADTSVIVNTLCEAFPEADRAKHTQALVRFLRRFVAAQFKRSCLPDGPMALGVSLSPRGGLHMPSDATAAAWLKELERNPTHA